MENVTEQRDTSREEDNWLSPEAKRIFLVNLGEEWLADWLVSFSHGGTVLDAEDAIDIVAYVRCCKF